MADEKFPPIKQAPKQPWVKGLSVEDKANYARVRADDIEKDVEAITTIFRSITDFEEVSDEAIGYMALRLATPMRDCYEEGIQVGREEERNRFQAERDHHHSVEVARLGGWG